MKNRPNSKDEWEEYAIEFAERIIDEVIIKIHTSQDKFKCSAAVVSALLHACAVVVSKEVKPEMQYKIFNIFKDYLTMFGEAPKPEGPIYPPKNPGNGSFSL